IKLKQDTSFIGHRVPAGTFARSVSNPGEEYALYIHHSVYGCWFWEPMQMGSCYKVVPGNYREDLILNFDKGTYLADWVNPSTGMVISSERLVHKGGKGMIKTPYYEVDIALRVKRIE
ncbi:MAG: hypothetical protein HZB98_09550, partial [Bacteroidia bacterium]|nr:hypothetical protein [Bacteroidia bacterium]